MSTPIERRESPSLPVGKMWPAFPESLQKLGTIRKPSRAFHNSIESTTNRSYQHYSSCQRSLALMR